MRELWRTLKNKRFEQAMVSGACNPKKVSISSLLWIALGIPVVLSPRLPMRSRKGPVKHCLKREPQPIQASRFHHYQNGHTKNL